MMGLTGLRFRGVALVAVACGACALLGCAERRRGVADAENDVDEGLQGPPGTPKSARQGGDHQDRLQEGQERARDRARHLGRRGLLRAARQVAQRTGPRMAGVGRGTPREPARGTEGGSTSSRRGRSPARNSSTGTWATSKVRRRSTKALRAGHPRKPKRTGPRNGAWPWRSKTCTSSSKRRKS